MKDIDPEKYQVVDNGWLAGAIREIVDEGIRIMKQEQFSSADANKIRTIKNLGTHINAAVNMNRLEMAAIRARLIQERMQQLGYDTPRQIPA